VNPFSDRSSIPKLARATKPRTGAPHGAAARPQSGNTLSWSGTRLKQACPRKVLQIRKYQKPAFCVAAEGKKGETRARARVRAANWVVVVSRLRYISCSFCVGVSKTASASWGREAVINLSGAL